MIKICSLDFLNKKTFETDIMSADGRVLFESDTKITPELILKLYFKNIYVQNPLKEIFEAPVKSEVIEESEILEESTEIAESEEITESVELEPTVSEDLEVPAEAEEEEEEEAESVILMGPYSISKDAELTAENVIEEIPDAIKINIKDKHEIAHDFKTKEPEESETKGPRMINSSAEEKIKDDNAKGPRMAETRFGKDEISKQEIHDEVNKEEIKAEIVEENPEEKQLEFDEQQAKRIVEYSLKIGRLLDFSKSELKDLEQVAYYSNIGIGKFKVKDLSKKEFNKMRAYASYEKLMEEGTVSNEIAEMIKYCANNYDSNAFPLNSKIPYHHIVAITSYYENLLLATGSKQTTLLKMLQLGGNQFNIFVLHKFINTMREANG